MSDALITMTGEDYDKVVAKARASAIDDAMEVVREYLDGEREGDMDIAELVPRLEALKEAKP